MDTEHLEIGCSCETSASPIRNGFPDTQSRNKPRILIVDDSENMRFLVSEFLDGFGYDEILTASNANEAFERLTEDPETPAADAVDLILMDINMPGIDGIDACFRIKGEMGCKDVPVIMVTNQVEPDYLKRAFQAGAMDYVTTPFNRLELQVRVKSALSLKQAMDAQKRITALVKDLLEERELALEAAKEKVKILHGLLPICASCKKIQNDSGNWSNWRHIYPTIPRPSSVTASVRTAMKNSTPKSTAGSKQRDYCHIKHRRRRLFGARPALHRSIEERLYAT